MKVKIFRENDDPADSYGLCKVPLEERINNFIEDKEVISIKYQSDICGYANDYASSNDVIEVR